MTAKLLMNKSRYNDIYENPHAPQKFPTVQCYMIPRVPMQYIVGVQ